MWLYVPPGSCPSAPASEDLSSASNSPTPEPELYATSNGKPSPRPVSWRGWKSRPWIKLLTDARIGYIFTSGDRSNEGSQGLNKNIRRLLCALRTHIDKIDGEAVRRALAEGDSPCVISLASHYTSSTRRKTRKLLVSGVDTSPRMSGEVSGLRPLTHRHSEPAQSPSRSNDSTESCIGLKTTVSTTTHASRISPPVSSPGWRFVIPTKPLIYGSRPMVNVHGWKRQKHGSRPKAATSQRG